MKLLSIAIPSYNSEAYLEKCVDSLLPGGEEVEILIVNDGSKDGTAALADRLSAAHPGIVRAIHKENGGHGSAVNTGLDHATGLFFKVVDSDDKVDAEAYREVLDTLRRFSEGEETLDLLISNYLYDKEGEKHKKMMEYRGALPTGRLFTWEEVGHLRTGHYILMHSVIFRTKMLKDSGIRLPEHCFYVDNIYVFEPLPFVKTMYYLDVCFYLYYIGREDQSVNEKIMISRLEQQMRVNRLMIDYYTDPANRERITSSPRLQEYMFHYLEIITTISSILAIKSGTKEHLQWKEELWQYLKEKDKALYKRLRSGLLGTAMNLPGRVGRGLAVGAYKIAQHFFGFN
ncbi:MAG: glycosyltransferase [Lachnospiraceae bacterium]|nr:glycosyltransferase [Lachnospiraceae bacterium]